MSKILPIIKYPNPILRVKSIDVKESFVKSKEFKNLHKDMLKTMLLKDGVGLSAPQIGQNIRLVVFKSDNKNICMINPIITKKSWSQYWDEEGCLSIPNQYGKVQRYKKINCIYRDENWKKNKIQATMLTARIIQHEIDHLNGELFIDKAKNLRIIDFV